MKQFPIVLVIAALAAAALTGGCATGKQDGAKALQESAKPAWSLKSSQEEMIVAASPMRKTLQLAGSTGFLLGAGVDFVINSDYRDAVRQALEGYDANAVFRACVESRLKDALPNAEGVPAFQGAAGYPNETEARQARYRALAKQGFDSVLDLRMRYGLYGTNVELVVELDADLVALPSGKKLWSSTVFATPGAAIASDRLGNPQKKKSSNESAPQFSVDKAAFERWTANKGELLRSSYERAVEGVTDTLLEDMGVATSAVGEMYLGKIASSRKDFAEANDLFEKALRIDPALIEARNAQSVNYAQAGQIKTAIEVAQAITKMQPEFAPAWYNLAWWHAIDLDDPAAARPYYEEAVRLGMPADSKIAEALEEK